MTPRYWRHLLPTAVLAICSNGVGAGVVIEPVVINIDSAVRSATIRVTNQGGQALRLQAAVYRWFQSGVDSKEPSDALLVVPPIAQIAPGASQVFRLALRRPEPAPRERAYRLLLEDISAAPEQGSENLTRFRLSHDLPVLVAPSGPPVRAIVWSDCGSGDSTKPPTAPASHCLRLANQGNRRFKVDAITLSGPNGEQRVKLPAARNVLAGSYLDLPMPADLPQLRSLRTVVVHATEGEPVQAQAASAP